jgi:molecular chaperone HtpG
MSRCRSPCREARRGAERIADGTRSGRSRAARSRKEEYTDFYRSVAGQYDEPALTVHFRAEGRHEYTALAFVPESKPFDLFDPTAKGRMKLYVKRVFITDEAELLPRYLRFVRGLVDTADLPLNVSREMIQESPLLAAIKKGVTSRVLTELDKLAENDAEAFAKVWETFGPSEGRPLRGFRAARDSCSAWRASRPPPRGGLRRSLKDYVGAEGEPDGDLLRDRRRSRPAEGLAAARRLPRPRHRGAAADRPVDSFWVTLRRFRGQAVQVVTQGAADLTQDPTADGETPAARETSGSRHRFHRLCQDGTR